MYLLEDGGHVGPGTTGRFNTTQGILALCDAETACTRAGQLWQRSSAVGLSLDAATRGIQVGLVHQSDQCLKYLQLHSPPQPTWMIIRCCRFSV
ncbi:hypothetical protein HZ326_26531 [Fusarium oxysporum f. sp. albedinis]|nr:hypothetical protein HZ326_26531 [Fusarium oxysporum f. sp. albedinis]